jgi:hypothetical protein
MRPCQASDTPSAHGASTVGTDHCHAAVGAMSRLRRRALVGSYVRWRARRQSRLGPWTSPAGFGGPGSRAVTSLAGLRLLSTPRCLTG